jgi:hypothetical protein
VSSDSVVAWAGWRQTPPLRSPRMSYATHRSDCRWLTTIEDREGIELAPRRCVSELPSSTLKKCSRCGGGDR